ncbi:MAG: sulfurtransferase TusA family protein [Nitrospinota bacterium]
MTERTLDLHGAICPDPLIQVQMAMEGLAAGDRLVVLLDYPLAVENITRWAESAGHRVEEVEKPSPGEWRLVLVKG